MKESNTTYTLLYFLISLTVAMLSDILLGPGHTHLPIGITSLEIQHIFGSGDPGSFARGGWIIFKNHWFSDENRGILGLWPPGFMVLQALVLKIAGPHSPLLTLLQVLAALLLGIVLNMFRLCLSLFTNKTYALFLPLLLFLFSQFDLFMLSQDGIVLGETFAISFVFIGFFSLILACKENNKRLAIIAGISFALGCYFRSHFDLFFLAGTLVWIGMYVFTLSFKKITQSNFFTSSNKAAMNPLNIILIALITLHLTTICYRLYNYHYAHSLSWVQTEDLHWQASFTPTKKFIDANAGFLVDGGINIACQIDKALCDQLSPLIEKNAIAPKKLRHYVFKTFFSHPIQWISLKTALIPSFWFSGFGSYGELVDPVGHTYLQSSIFTVCVLFSLFSSIIMMRNNYFFVTFWLNASLCAAFFSIFMFAHIEARYFLFFKFYFLVSAILNSCMLLKGFHKQRVSHSPLESSTLLQHEHP